MTIGARAHEDLHPSIGEEFGMHLPRVRFMSDEPTCVDRTATERPCMHGRSSNSDCEISEGRGGRRGLLTCGQALEDRC